MRRLCLNKSRYWLYLSGLLSNWRECLIGLSHILRFAKVRLSARAALIVEFNPFHGETLPGFVHYFQELGYEVTVLTRYVNYADSPFVRMKTKPRHYCLTIWGMQHLLKSKKAQEFDFILYNSAHLYLNEHRYYGRVLGFLGGNVIGGRRGFALIEHSLKPGTDLEYFQRLPENAPDKQNLFHHSFVLTEQVLDEHKIPMLNPCYFGEVRHEHKLNAKRIFLTIGNVSPNGRNFKQLFDAIETLNNTPQFEVWIIGRILDRELVQTIPSCVRVLGRLTFADMYDRLEQADFFLPLLDPKTQSLYLQGCTSGSRQLILGFCIPPVIHEAFAEHYGFTPDSCLTYTDDHTLGAALKQALLVSKDTYSQMKKALGDTAQNVQRKSMDNLRMVFEA